MNVSGLYIYLDGSNLADIAPQVEASIRGWLQESGLTATIVNQRHETSSEEFAELDLGLILGVEQIQNIQAITSFLYDLALQHKRDFALGCYDETTGESEDISYFGVECGRPKIAELPHILATLSRS